MEKQHGQCYFVVKEKRRTLGLYGHIHLAMCTVYFLLISRKALAEMAPFFSNCPPLRAVLHKESYPTLCVRPILVWLINQTGKGADR